MTFQSSFLLLLVGALLSSSKGASSSPKFVMDVEGSVFNHRLLQEQFFNGTAKCFSTFSDDNLNRYCTFDDTPREGTFLVVACPHSRGEDLLECECTIGIGLAEDAPNTPTCGECSFCRDGTLLYNCDNVARGTCIGRSCGDECIASLEYAESGAASVNNIAVLGALISSFLSLSWVH